VSGKSSVAHRIQVGDSVAYSQTFLDRQNRTPANMPSAQGKVKALHRLQSGIILADIEWNKPGLPKRVNIKNLTKTEADAIAE
jgi:hypothetical protein